MSWVHQRGPKATSTAANSPAQIYNPNQHSLANNQWQQQDTQNWYNTTPQQQQFTHDVANLPQNYWQQPYSNQPQLQTADGQRKTTQYSDQYQGQALPHQQNVGHYEQQAYGNLPYNQQFTQNNSYVSQSNQQYSDDWNWGWGADEDNSNIQPALQKPVSSTSSVSNFAESFANDESWNWSVQDNKNSSELDQQDPQSMSNQPKPENKLLNRGKLDTPQWSTESQPSQESSDDILHTSESDKSHMMSRSSTISHSPTFGQDSKIADVNNEVENKEIVLPPPPPVVPSPGTSDGVKNPYKRASGLSHNAANSFRTTNITPPDPRPPSFMPPPINNQSVNLETVPDNSEHPDHLSTVSSPNTSKNIQQWQQIENSEVPINDRNQYLETGQLSNTTLGEGNDILPPPGLQRMIPGQLEQGSGGGKKADPLPGFSRMVLGQTENPVDLPQAQTSYDSAGPPEGLHRMVPGESSSPETTLHQPPLEENDSEPELSQLNDITSGQPRSATIGADTPPIMQNVAPSSSSLTSNRSETIGRNSGQDSSIDPVHIRGASASSSESRGGFPPKTSKGKEKAVPEQHGHRREFIEGQTNDTVSDITNSIRNLTVGENPIDSQTSVGLTEHRMRRQSRQESSDSDSESKLPPRLHRDKRSAEKPKQERERHSDRYSPDPYKSRRDKRDKRYKDSRYEEDTDCYSDKEGERRLRNDRDREYDRKYNSLRKEKERRRKEREPRERRNDYYYPRYRDEYDNQSRPSSRSDSMHESFRERRHDVDPRERRYRERDRERDNRYRSRDQRDSYNPYQSYAYDPFNPYYQQYQYYENLRRTNPQAYAEWYRKYYQQVTGSTASYTGDDRASVHSGRSSANDELAKDRYTRQSFYSQSSHLANYYGHSHSMSDQYGLDQSSSLPVHSSSLYEEQAATAQRLTPAKFATAHTKGSISSGKLVQILPNYRLDGQNTVVELINLQCLLENDEQYIELSSFPGPLVKGVTHKKTIIEYCDNKIQKAHHSKISDVESYILMWELLKLLIRQNGMVIGTDIAELLLKNCKVDPTPRPPSVLSNASSTAYEHNQVSEIGSDEPTSLQTSPKEEEITRKFREYLLYGSCKEALEWAMKHGLWGHALFLASKLDKRTYANVMMRFANGLAINDPLQTLYQLLSGKMPAAVTCVADEKWGNWRPHLAMILSNSTQLPELNCKAITTLGDTLLNRGNIYAAQFCYLMAEVGFGKHGNPDTRLVLLGTDHRSPYPQLATNEAIHMTEIYEYACSLNDQRFVITEFQMYKYLLATRLADFGLLEKSLSYLEKLSEYIVGNPSEVSSIFVDHVCNLADKLKFYDPVGDEEDESKFGGLLETSRPDNSWLNDLKAVQSDFQAGVITQSTYSPPEQTYETDYTLQPADYSQTVWQPNQHYQENLQSVPVQQEQMQQMSNENHADYSSNQYQEQPTYWSGQQEQQFQQWNDGANHFDPESTINQEHSPYDINNQSEGNLHQTQPQISMPNQQIAKSAFNDEPLPHQTPEKTNTLAKQELKSPKKDTKQSTGWFGGIFSKLSIKPKNQMILPDDKNPKIVWDESKKRWTNVDEDGNETVSEFKPPPKMSDIKPQGLQQPHSMPGTIYGNSTGGIDNNYPSLGADLQRTTPAMPASVPNNDNVPPKANMFKLQRGRNLKNSYIDVFNPNGGKSASGPASLPGGDKLQAAAPQMNFFVPPTVNDPNAPVDFLTPAPPLQFGEQAPET